jgi:hypothetical protein
MLLLLADENPKESTELIKEFSKVSGYKTNLKLNGFLHNSYEQQSPNYDTI